MEARIITDRQQWDDFIASSTCCNITQSYEWGTLGKRRGDDDVLPIGVVDTDGRLCAAMLVLAGRVPTLKQLYFYAPRGPVIDDPTSPALTTLLDFVKAEARRRRAFMLKVEPSVEDGDTRWLTALRQHGFRTIPYFSHPRHEWVLDIRPEEKELLAGMKEKWRYNIRLAARKGITVRRGEGQADIDAFYRIYQTTSQRDQFFIHNKDFYQDVLRLYSQDDRAVLFMAEYEGQPIAATITLCLGRWSWYMYGASSNEQRERMPNHLLQWTGIQWARSRGCWFYNFRGIPDVLEEGHEMWGIYLFKRGFGGYPLRFLQTHDLVYQPLVYQAYRRLLDLKRWRDERQHKQQQQKQPVKS
ncbi:MAG: peptidoglycan bridge formation glycyltransferase FemA/FemB family protein [Ktedonobacteraceae bacterium]|nr:peptidoglycan bridge formation glycyltransferase FemA/FemB family protein [Ktedonobacteraceae bacterium]